MFFSAFMSHARRTATRRVGLTIVTVAAVLAVAAVAHYRFAPSTEVLAPAGTDLDGYVGAARCAECHRQICDQQSCSRMAETLETAEEYVRKHSLRLPAVLFDVNGRLRYRIDRRDGQLGLEVMRGGEVARAEMSYALGSGKQGVTFVRELDADHYEELRVSYYAQTGQWDLTPGQTAAPPASAAEALGRPFPKRGDTACLNCHASLLVQSEGKIDLARSRFGVDCERCHGPGREHVESALNGSPTRLRAPELVEALDLAQRFRAGRRAETPQDELLRSVSELNDERVIRDLYVCGECHGRNEIFSPPSEELLPKFPVAALVASACYQRSAAKLLCNDCHDPHGDSESGDRAYVAACLNCHSDGPALPVGEAAADSQPETAGAPPVPQIAICPVNPRDGCIACHMPSRSTILQVRLTQHRIAVYRDHGAPQKTVGRNQSHLNNDR